MILGIDAGNYYTKVASHNKVFKFPSNIGEYREMNLEVNHGEYDMVVEYKNQRYFAGTLAKYESEFGSTMFGDSKAHLDGKLRVLIATYLTCNDNSRVQIVTGQPIGKHREKTKIKRMLEGMHTLTVNGITKRFTIDRVEVAPEGAGAFWAFKQQGKIRILDIGSGTINCATIIDGRYVDKDSFTLPFGANTTNSTHEQFAKGIQRAISRKWTDDVPIYLIGGIATLIEPYLNAKLLPIKYHPTFANALGFYQLGVTVFFQPIK